VNTVYFANALTHYPRIESSLREFEPSVLKEFNITSEEQLLRLQQRLDAAFVQQTQ
jgi:polyphosphate kinase 2 (PPK2 family)